MNNLGKIVYILIINYKYNIIIQIHILIWLHFKFELILITAFSANKSIFFHVE